MGYDVESFYETTRQEGVNCGLPMTFMRMGLGQYFPKVEDLVGTILSLANCNWVAIVGEDTTRAGMGSVTRGLWQCGFSTEVEVSGERKDPSWLNSVTKWVVDYTDNNVFNFGALRSNDQVRFVVSTPEDFELVKIGFEELQKLPSIKYIRYKPDTSKMTKGEVNQLAVQCIDFLKKYDRARMF